MVRRLVFLSAVCSLLCVSVSAAPLIARFQSVLGDFDVLLDPAAAPRTVENFTAYANRGDYADSFIHRSTTYDPSSIQVVQGGGFFIADNTVFDIPAQAPIVLETNRNNTRGTVAMARTPLPDSATSQWFFNLTDNTSLDPGTFTGGYAVFGDVMGQGMMVIDAIGDLAVYSGSTPQGLFFGELPLIDGQNLVLINSVRVEPFAITNIIRTAEATELRWTALSTNTPVRIERTTNLAGSWETIASNNTTGVFNDTNPPAGTAYYRVVTE